MKKFILHFVLMVALVTAAIPFTVHSAPDNRISDAGRKFVELLASNDFAGAVIQFDGTMKTVMPEPKLRELWQSLQKQAGPFQKKLRVYATKSGGYDAAAVLCQFARAALDVRVVFDAKQRVAGLFFENAAMANDKPSPASYADANAFREIEVKVGRGQLPLPATLTLPKNGKGLWPAVVLVHGSGPGDRDETIGSIKPFQDLAWGLATKGIAVLRYEKRTRQYPITDFWKPGMGPFTVREETIDDAVSAVAQLRARDDIDSKRIFILGHSLGGMVAPRIAQTDPQIAGLVILAGAVRPFDEVIVEQARYITSLHGKPSAEEDAYLAQVEADANKLKQLTAADASSRIILFGAPVTYWLDMREHDSLAAAKQIQQPMLFLQGWRDYQVTIKDYEIWRAGLADHPRVTFKLYPQLNHLFVTGTGKSTPTEYEQPGHVDARVVTDIAGWILENQNP
jgi:dienelactone hydrolase